MASKGNSRALSPSVAGPCVPREGSKPAESETSRLMKYLDLRPNEGTDSGREVPNHHGIKLFGHDISDDQEGELIAIYSPGDNRAMDGQIAYARPRDFIDLGDAR